MTKNSTPLRVGIGGPVGSGKTALTLALCQALREQIDMAVVTNDIYTAEDAKFLVNHSALAPERIIGVETGGCPHTAIREDASINLEAVDRLERAFPDVELILKARKDQIPAAHHGVMGGAQLLDLGQHRPAVRRKHNAAPVSTEEGDAQLRLQGVDGVANARLGEIHSLRRLGKAPASGGFQENLILCNTHKTPSYHYHYTIQLLILSRTNMRFTNIFFCAMINPA